MSDFIASCDVERFSLHWRDVASSRAARHCELSLGRDTMQQRVGICTDPVIAPDGRVKAFRVSLSELTPFQRSQRELAEARQALADQLRDTERLHEISMRVVGEADLPAMLQEIISVAIAITRADMGNMSLVDEATGEWIMQAHSGANDRLTELSKRLYADDIDTLCGQTVKSGRRVVVPDVADIEPPVDAASGRRLADIGVRAWASTPMISRCGRVLGVITTLHQSPTTPGDWAFRRLDLLARQAADLIERTQAEAAWRLSERRLRGIFESSAVLMSIVELRDDDYIYVQPNEQIAGFFGLTAGELTGKSAREMGFPESKIAECVETFRRCANTREADSREYSFSIGDKTFSYFGTISYIGEEQAGPQFSLTLIDVTEKKDAEASLRASEDRYRTLVDHATDALLLHDRDGVVVDVNRQACEALGYTRDELIGMSPLAFDPQVKREDIVGMLQRLDAGETIAFDSVHVRKDGTQFPVEVRIRPFWVDGVRFGLSLSRDISKRKRAEEELRASEARYRTFVDHASDAIFLHDHEGRVIDVNRQACLSLGYRAEELIGMTPLDFDVSVTRDGLRELHRRLDAGESLSFDTVHRRKDGVVFPVEIRAQPLVTNGKRLALAMVRDISDRKRAEEALARSESRFRGAIENIPDVIVIYDRELRIQYINAAARRLTGRPASDFVGKRDDEIWPPNVYERYLPTVESARRSGRVESVETDIEFPDGTVRSLHITCVPLLNDDGTIGELVGITRDFTERKRAGQAIRESEQRFSQFMEYLPGLAWIKDASGRYVYANHAAARDFGVAPSEVVGKTDNDLFPSDTATEFRESDRHVLSSGKGVQLYESRRDSRGVERHALISKFPIPPVGNEEPLVGGVAIDTTQHMQAEETIRRIVEGTAPTTGQDFFRALASHLSDACHVDCAFVGRIDPSDHQRIDTIAVSRNGETIENFSYDLRGSPCEEVVSRGVCYLAGGVRERFPDDKLLADMNVESYMGTPLFSSEGVLLGLVVLIHGQSIAQSDQAMAILRVVAARAGAELERELTQAELGRTRLEFDFLAESFPSMVFRADAHGRFVTVNDGRWMRLAGLDAGTWRGDRWLSAVHPDDRARVAVGWERFVSNCDIWAEEFRLLRPDGTVVWVLAQAVPMRDSTGRVADLFGVYIDITHLIETKQALRLTQFSVDQASIAIFWIDRESRIRYVNDWACKSVGYSREELLDMSMIDLTPHTPESWGSRFETVKRKGSIWFESRHRHKQGHYFPIEVTVNYVRFSGEDFLFAFAQDVTERKKVEDRLEQQSVELAHVSRLSTMGEMVATLSHELAQPLSAVANYASACAVHLERLRSEDATLAEYVDGIARQTNRAGEILRRVRDFVRNTVHQKAVYDLNLLLDDSLALMFNDFRRHDITVLTEFVSEPVLLWVDRVQIQQVVVNLLTNARDAMSDVRPASRVVTVRSTCESGHAAFEVEDCGVGLPAEIRERVFEPFVTTKDAGMGIGLSICKTIVESHGGTIASDAGRSGGARFRVVLPLAEGESS